MILAFDVIGVLITTRRPGNAIGWLVLLIGLSWSAGDLLNAFGQYGFDHGWSNADVLIALSQPTWLPPIGLTGTFLILLFPDGHLPSPRWRWFAWTIGIGMTVVGLVLLLAPGTFEDSGYPTVSNPLGIEALRSFEGRAADRSPHHPHRHARVDGGARAALPAVGRRGAAADEVARVRGGRRGVHLRRRDGGLGR